MPDEEDERDNNEYLNDCLNVVHTKEYADDKNDEDDDVATANCDDGDME